MELEPALLGGEKNAHQPARLIAENTLGNRINFAIEKFESVDEFLAGILAALPDNLPEGGEKLWLRHQRQPLLDRARDQIDVARVGVKIAHEIFQALARRSIGKTQVERDGRLHAFGQNIGGAADVVMQLVADPQ